MVIYIKSIVCSYSLLSIAYPFFVLVQQILITGCHTQGIGCHAHVFLLHCLVLFLGVKIRIFIFFRSKSFWVSLKYFLLKDLEIIQYVLIFFQTF